MIGLPAPCFGRKGEDSRKKAFISTVLSLVVLSFSAAFSGAQGLEAPFFLRAPAEVAQDLFQKLFTMKPDDEDLYVDAGLGRLEKGNSQKAAEFFAKGLNLDPKKGKLYLKIGQAYVKKN